MTILDKTEKIHKLIDYKGPFDAAIVVGYGPVQPGFTLSSGKLNIYGRLNSLATGMLYEACEIRKIIPTGTKTGGAERPSEAELMYRIITSKFNVPDSAFILEEQATSTILNVVCAANIIDKFLTPYKRLLFLAMGFHHPRIREICSLVGLEGQLVIAEQVVNIRSEHHRHFLFEYLQPEKKAYAITIADQPRWLRGLKEIPEYWLPQIAMVENSDRLRRILKTERIQPFVQSEGINVSSQSPESLREWLRSIRRKMPPEHWAYET